MKSPSNNFGFSSTIDFPFARTSENQCIIGVVGGSVAELFCKHGARRVGRELRTLDRFRGKQMVILNLSRGGFKQPQQVMVLSYFLSIGQEFDVVINIDGFNEIALAGKNETRGIDGSMPSYGHLEALINLIDQETMTFDRLESVHAIAKCRKTMTDLRERYHSSVTAIAGLLRYKCFAFVHARYTREIYRMDHTRSQRLDDSIVFLKETGREKGEHEIIAKVADIWARSSVIMGSICEGNGIEYYQFIQPNQYFSGKTFTADELENAVSSEADFANHIRTGYPELLERVPMIRSHGVNLFSAVQAFDQEAETVYVDKCCHFNNIGNRLLAAFIVEKIAGGPP